MYVLKGTSPDHLTSQFHKTFRKDRIYMLHHYLKANKKKTSQITYEVNKTLLQNPDKDRNHIHTHDQAHV